MKCSLVILWQAATAAPQVLYYWLLLRLIPLHRLVRRIESRSLSCLPNSDLEQASARLRLTWRVCTFVLCRLLRSSRPCLPRSLVLYDRARRFGLEARLVIGVQRQGDGLDGHGWLEVDGKPFLEESAQLQTYRVMLTFPESSEGAAP